MQTAHCTQLYKIRVTTHDAEWVSKRRYSEFLRLKERLESVYPDSRYFAFPPKKWFNNMSLQVVDERKTTLNEFLQTCLFVQQIVESRVFHEFLGACVESVPAGPASAPMAISETDGSPAGGRQRLAGQRPRRNASSFGFPASMLGLATEDDLWDTSEHVSAKP